MNVVMKRLRKADLEMVMDWRMRPYITQYMNTDPVLTIDGQQKWYEKVTNDASQINWVIHLDNAPIGFINIVNIDHVNSHCSWGYYIAEKTQVFAIGSFSGMESL